MVFLVCTVQCNVVSLFHHQKKKKKKKVQKNAFGRRLTNRGSLYLMAFKSYRLSLEIDLDFRIDLDRDPITFIHELNLDTIEIYLYTKNEVHRSRHSKVID